MTDRADLIRKADDLKAKAENEPDAAMRARLLRMAEDYAHLAEGEAQKEAHPVDAAALGEVLTKREP